MSKVTIKRSDDPGAGNTVSTLDRDTVISVLDDEGNVQSQVRLSELRQRSATPVLDLIVDNELPPPPPPVLLPDEFPDWAMPLDIHNASAQRTAVYRCLHCEGEHEEYRTSPRDLPYAKVCGCLVEGTNKEIEKCTAPALRRFTLPGEGVALNARRFEQLSVYEIANYDSKPDDYKRSHNRFYVPGRNTEPTEPGMIRHDITNMQAYNRFIKNVNSHELEKMRDHRSMHEAYWGARRKAMRDDVNARIRHEPLLLSLARIMRKRSDQKSNQRYGKSLDPHFHAQLLEFNQSNMQDFCAEDTNWKSRRAK